MEWMQFDTQNPVSIMDLQRASSHQCLGHFPHMTKEADDLIPQNVPVENSPHAINIIPFL